MQTCSICPRDCRVNRAEGRGFCGVGEELSVSKIMLHHWEEPCISGKNGSGAIFLCGCPLKCAFCQNRPISHGKDGVFEGEVTYTEERLTESMLRLRDAGAHNVNLVSPTQYTEALIRCIDSAKNRGLDVPVVWNTGGYEKPETVRALEGRVDIFLTDVKYFSSELSSVLSGARDYFERALESLLEMVRITGSPELDEDGIMRRGVIVRHLVLPSCRRDSAEILTRLSDAGLSDRITLSLMSQYTPEFFTGCSDAKLDRAMRRRVTTFEYEYVREIANDLGFTGYAQERASSTPTYTPNWGE